MSSSRQGWTAGDIVASKDDPGRGNWLTVWGSYYTAPQLHSTPEAAKGSQQRGDFVALVTEVDYPGVGRAYRITGGTLTRRAEQGCGAQRPGCAASWCARPYGHPGRLHEDTHGRAWLEPEVIGSIPAKPDSRAPHHYRNGDKRQ